MAEDRTMRTARTFPCTPERLYDAFASAETLASWWGPDGFTNTFDTFEFQVGGSWNLVMRGPDGREYPNRNLFLALERPSRIVIRHDNLPHFTLTVRLASAPGGTHLSWEQVFDDLEMAQAVRSVVVPANEQNLDRLARALGLVAAGGA